MKNLSSFLVWTLLFVAFSGCADKTGSQKNQAYEVFSPYIQGHTSGTIGSGESIQVLLTNSVEGYVAGEEIKERLFEFSPTVKGKAFLTGNNIVEFRPDKPLKNGARYTVGFDLKQLVGTAKQLAPFAFQFEVIPLSFTVEKGNLAVGNYKREDLLNYEGKILCSDRISESDLKKLFATKGTGISGNIRFEQIDATTYQYVIDSIPRTDKSGILTLQWNGSGLNIKESGSYDIEIPGRNEFKVLNVTVEQGEEQFVRIDFSDPLDPSQSLQGMFFMGEGRELRISRVNATVYLYPVSHVSGEEKLWIEAGIRSDKGNSLQKEEVLLLSMEPTAPQVEFVGNGSIMPDSKGLFLPFRAVSLRAVDVIVYKIYSNTIPQFFQANTLNTSDNIKSVGRPVYQKTIRLDLNRELDLKKWNVFSIDLTPLVKKDPKALYKVDIRFRLPFAITGCAEDTPSDLTPYYLPETFDEAYLSKWNTDEYYWEDYYPADFQWDKRDDPCHVSYYIPDRFISKNVLATNLGILVKSYDQRKYTLLVTDLLSAKPVAGAKVTLYNFQQQVLGEGNTSADGLAEVMPDGVPYLVVASLNSQNGYLRVDDGSCLSTSSFDVAGDQVKKGIKGFLYGERDVWRPGDTLFMTFLLADKERLLPADQPVVFELYNSRNQLVSKQVQSSGKDGFYCFPTPTGSDDPTGNWLAAIQVGGTRFEKQVKVESIKPNRLKINIDFTGSPLRSGRSSQKALFRSAWLHGAPASNLKAEVKVRFTKGTQAFKGYPGFSFDDPAKDFTSYEETVFDGALDGDGYVEFPLNFQSNPEAPGMLNAIFNSRVFEQGGDFSTDMIAVPFSPFDRYVGISTGVSPGEYKTLETGKDHQIQVVVVNPDGQPVTTNRLIARVYKIDWRWWWSASEEYLASYVGRKDVNLVQETMVNAPGGKGSFTFRVDYPDWGRYLVIVSDLEKGHSAGQVLYIDWPSSVDRSGRENPSGAAILSFSADKKVYHPGDKAQITFPSMENSRALMTIESGTRVLESRWVETQKGETRISLDITPAMSPNVYLYLTLIQPHASSSNDLPIRMYGVIPLMVEDPASRLQPRIKLPEEIRPEQEYVVEVSEQSRKAMTYTLAVVDEGLLNLTRFKTPDPWTFFNMKEALGVKTWDNYGDVLGAYGGRLESVLAIGGDGELVNPADQKANRFKPVVTFIGPFELKKGGSNKHTLRMPNYVGSVKAMVVAAKNNSWGSAEATAPVKKPLMVLATVPRILSFGERLDVPVSLFTLDEKIKAVDVSITTQGPLSVVGSSEQSIAISRIGEENCTFSLKSGTLPGIGKIRVEVSSGPESAFYEVEIEIHNPNPIISRVVRYTIEPGKEAKLVPAFESDAETSQTLVEIATLPSFDLEKHLNYLISYPYGCVEQTTSSAFAQICLNELVELSEKDQKRVELNINSAILALAKFQLPDGSLAYWPGGRTTSSWGTTYALHFLLAAEQKGYLIPAGCKKKLVSYQSKSSSAPGGSGEFQEGYELQQAYRLFTLAMAGQPNLSAMNRMTERKVTDPSATWMLASAYCLIGRLQVAEKLVQNMKPYPGSAYRSPGSTFGSDLRDQGIILNTLTLMKRNESALDLLEKMAKSLQGSEVSTQTAAYCLYAIAEFAGSQKDPGSLNFTYATASGKKEVKSRKPVYRMELSDNGSGTNSVTNTGSDRLYATVTTLGRPPIGVEETYYSNLKISIDYLDLNNRPVTVSRLEQGSDLKARVTIANPGIYGVYENMALSQVFPSGWEIINYRVTDQESFVAESPYEYRDVRDDRVFTFFTLAPGQQVTYEVLLNAAYTGEFYLPALQCGDMYDRKISAVVKGQWVQVVK